jgi:hypothetical protein
VDPQSRSRRYGKVIIIALPGLELRPHGRSARSQSLYRLCYRGTLTLLYTSYLLFKCTHITDTTLHGHFSLNYVVYARKKKKKKKPARARAHTHTHTCIYMKAGEGETVELLTPWSPKDNKP